MTLTHRPIALDRPTCVLMFGGGQDSTALLYHHYYDAGFRNQYARNCHFVVVMSDTGNEYPATLNHIAAVRQWCARVGIDFYFLTPDMGYHRAAWSDLKTQMERNNTIMGVAFPKSCTDQLKIQPSYRFLGDWLRANYHYGATDYRVFDQYRLDYGPLAVWIGFAAGEESRVDQGTVTRPDTDGQLRLAGTASPVIPSYVPRWRARTIIMYYPLIELGLDRGAVSA